ncbi:hypothetical protein ALC53_04345 [Atta colombica]|uniref:Uncharacterized protein n=1 Tax=Atta colombica TaxID=520822 RepID=A0A151I4I2_9HYME|nr:hypothetical protein ALC53_04345 [Atta colombica]
MLINVSNAHYYPVIPTDFSSNASNNSLSGLPFGYSYTNPSLALIEKSSCKCGAEEDTVWPKAQRIALWDIVPHNEGKLPEAIQFLNVKLTLNGIYLYMKSTTMLFLFELKQCVEHVFYELSQYTDDVNKKFEYFVSFLKQNYIINKSDAANILYKIYDKKILL